MLIPVLSLVVSIALSEPPAQAPSVERPCSFASAADMSTLLGARVTAATDEHFRCKYTVGSGWLETKLMDISLKMTRDIFDYNKAHGQAMPGVGDQAFILGATIAVKLGDVVIVVDGSNMPRPMPSNATLKNIAMRIVRAIP